MSDFFTADIHFNHSNIITYCKRPFNDVLEMNEVLIANWNRVVKPKDRVFHLGDFGFGEFRHILDRLNGKIFLLVGSHDKDTLIYEDRFDDIADILEVVIEGHHIVLCHYCMRVWSKSHFNSWHLYGHSHGQLAPEGKSWDVGVDNNNFMPVSFKQIKAIMEKRPDNFNLIRRSK
jgi:calcineurin-like phosphoesterase family protein